MSVCLIQKHAQKVVPLVSGLNPSMTLQSRVFLESWKHIIEPQALDRDSISFTIFLPSQESGLLQLSF